MGTPKLEPISVSERTRLLMLAAKIAASFNDEEDIRRRYADVLEELRAELYSMVQWLDNPLKDQFPFSDPSVPSPAQSRGVVLINGFGHGTPSLGLARSGQWILLLHKEHKAEVKLAESQEVFDSFFAKEKHIWPAGYPTYSSLEKAKALEFFDGIIRHLRFQKILTLICEGARKVIEEREERFRIMKDKLGFWEVFTKALDPLEYGEPSSGFEFFSISRKTEHGTSRSSSDYLTEKQVQEVLTGRQQRNRDRDLYVSRSPYTPRSLSELLRRVMHLLDDMSEKGDKEWPHDKRLPFSKEELAIIRERTVEICSLPTDFLRALSLQS